jgi:hypothetical protein
MDVPTMLRTYGSVPISHVFNNNEQNLTMNMATSAATEAAQKRHAACDQCRQRKLKCSGEVTGCSRCVKNNLVCIYSEQKQMGRPKKRQRTDDDTSTNNQQPSNPPPRQSMTTSQYAPPPPIIDPSLSASDMERNNFQNICTAPMAQSVRRSAAASSITNSSPSLNNTPSIDQPHTPPDTEILSGSYPTDYALWPDFSDTEIPLPVLDGYGTKPLPSESGLSSSTNYLPDPDVDPSLLSTLPSVPDCPCLPNLYLTLSTLSTLSAFPVSTHTVRTLQSAHRTARNVLYCAICPQKFQSGSQNVMLSGTLLTVLVDQWARVLKCPARDLRAGFSEMPSQSSDTLTPIQDLEWRTFAYDLVRHHVFGDRTHPVPPATNQNQSTQMQHVTGNDTITLLSLANAMERRQREWHAPPSKESSTSHTNEFPERLTHALAVGHTAGLTLEEIRAYEAENSKGNEEMHLCLQLVRHAKMCIRSLDRGVPRLEAGGCGG